MAAQQNFRTAFNGFNREDVVHYIEYLNSKHTAEINQLNSEIEFLRSKVSKDESEVDPLLEQQTIQVRELLGQNTTLEEELNALRAEKEQLETQLAEAMTAGTEIENQLNAAVAEKEALATQLEAAKNQQTAAESRTADELEAYRRAERTERKAQERAGQMYRQANGVIADATVKVSEAADQIGALSESVMAQLAQLQQAVSGSSDTLKDAAAVLYAIRPETEE